MKYYVIYEGLEVDPFNTVDEVIEGIKKAAEDNRAFSVFVGDMGKFRNGGKEAYIPGHGWCNLDVPDSKPSVYVYPKKKEDKNG